MVLHWKNTIEQYGLVSKLLHWLSAFTIIGLYCLGIWMVELDYYSQWYKTAPHWHKSIGILLLGFTVFRLIWRITTINPQAIASHSILVIKASKVGHYLLYLCLITVLISGYLISTADGRHIEVFNWFELMSLGELFQNQEDIAGVIHQKSTDALIILASIHALAAIKHHIIDKDQTLNRMIK